VSRAEDGTYQIAPGWDPAKGVVFEGNCYSGSHIDRPEDDSGSVEQAAAEPAVDWYGPCFDPAKPEGFDGFLAKQRARMNAVLATFFGKWIEALRRVGPQRKNIATIRHSLAPIFGDVPASKVQELPGMPKKGTRSSRAQRTPPQRGDDGIPAACPSTWGFP